MYIARTGERKRLRLGSKYVILKCIFLFEANVFEVVIKFSYLGIHITSA